MPQPELSSDAPYRILHRLGAGGMGEVFEAVDTRSNMRVALKTLHRVGPLALYLFKNEFRSLAHLSHPNLVGLYELGQSGETPWFTMELVPGAVDLLARFRGESHRHGATWLSARGDLDPDATLPPTRGTTSTALPDLPEPSPLDPSQLGDLRELLGQLADALQVLHVSGRLHRDVKPANVLVAGDRVVLVDFGLVATLDGVQRAAPSSIAGSIPYMSPEQSEGDELGPASDWYAFGAVLYELLTGRPPFAGARAAVLAAKRGREVVPPAQVVEGVPPELDALCTALLSLDPAARPSGDHVRAALGREAPIVRSAEVPLIGRATQLQCLRDALGRVRAGAAATVHVHGDSGMGKSALVEQIVREANDALVLRGRCYERDSLPYKAVDPIVDALASWLAELPQARSAALAPRHVRSLVRLFPVLDRVAAFENASQRTAGTPDEEQRRALRALRELLARVAEQRTLVVVIDDLQWSDRDSFTALNELVRQPDPPVMLLLLVYRNRALMDPRLTTLADDATQVGIAPLQTDEARRLAQTQLQDPAMVEAVVREAAGSPFYTLELARHAAHTGTLVDLPAYAAERVAELPELTRELVSVLAVASVPTRRQVLLDCVDGVSPAAITALQAGRLVRSEGPEPHHRVGFDHDRIRESVAADLPEELRAALHARLAAALIRHEGSAERISDHLLACGDTRRATHYTRLAADHASETLAFHREVEMVRRLLDLVPEGPERPALLERYGDALHASGRGREAAQAYLAAVEAGAHPRLETTAARLLIYSGHLEEGRPVAQRVLRRNGVAVPRWRPWMIVEGVLRRVWQRLRALNPEVRRPRDVSSADVDRLDALFSLGHGLIVTDQTLAFYLLVRYVAEALRVGHPDYLISALADDGFIANAEPGGGPRADRAYALASEIAPLAAPRHVAWLETMRMIGLVQLGRVREAGDALDHAKVALQRARALAIERDWVEMFDVGFAGHREGPASYVRREAELVALARDRQNVGLEIHTRAGLFFCSALIRDQPDRGDRDMRDLLARWEGEGDLQTFYCIQTLVRIACYRGDGRGAVGLVDEHQAMVGRSGAFQSGANRMTWAVVVGIACLHAFAETRRPAYLERARQCADRAGREGPWGRLGELQLVAMVAWWRGEDEQTRDALSEAVALAEQEDLGTWRQVVAWMAAAHRGDEQERAAIEAWARDETVVDPVRWFEAWCGPLPCGRMPG